MIVTSNIDDLRELLKPHLGHIGFVPTMGALHQGHLSLIKHLGESSFKVMSIFVNPIQFGRNEDLSRYPRPIERDMELCRESGIDLLFTPSNESVYPRGYRTYVEVEDWGNLLCGRVRAGHFRGVATVVLKLFNIVKPSIAAFGWKDAQQGLILRKMVSDLNLDVEIVLCPIVRDSDGLALSSRNAYLTQSERNLAARIPECLQCAGDSYREGLRDFAQIREGMLQHFRKHPEIDVEYIEAVNMDDLEPAIELRVGVLLALAVRIGSTRLIDNWRVGAEPLPFDQ